MHRPWSTLTGILIVMPLGACGMDADKCVQAQINASPADYVVLLHTKVSSRSTIMGLVAKYDFTLDDTISLDLGVFSAVLTKDQSNGLRCEPPVQIIEVNDSVHAFPSRR